MTIYGRLSPIIIASWAQVCFHKVQNGVIVSNGINIKLLLHQGKFTGSGTRKIWVWFAFIYIFPAILFSCSKCLHEVACFGGYLGLVLETPFKTCIYFSLTESSIFVSDFCLYQCFTYFHSEWSLTQGKLSQDMFLQDSHVSPCVQPHYMHISSL